MIQYQDVYQFKISLGGIKPVIWRRIQVPGSYSFWDLHIAIQDAMGWLNCHLHEFNILNPETGDTDRIGIPDEEWDFDDTKLLAGWKTQISSYFSAEMKKARYTYDFGDDWEHTVILEKIIAKEPGLAYPQCLDGAHACPPEDCGGVLGYYHLMEVMGNPKDKEYASMVEWYGRVYKPEIFNPKIVFSNPAKSLEMLLAEQD